MKNIFIVLASAICINVLFHFPSVLAESKDKASLGSPKMCLDTTRIKETILLDDQTILFKMLGDGIYINRLPFHCPGLKISDGFVYSTTIAKLCKQDIISVLWPDAVSGSKCGIGYFWPFKYEGESKDAIKLLREGFLNELVKKGAFKKKEASENND